MHTSLRSTLSWLVIGALLLLLSGFAFSAFAETSDNALASSTAENVVDVPAPVIDATDTAAIASDTTQTESSVSGGTEAPLVVDAPTITSEAADYEPGELVTLFGKFFAPLQHFIVRIFGNSEVGNHISDTSIDVNSDATGGFTLTHLLDNFYRPTYDVTATDDTGSVVAQSSFTDAANATVQVYSQCANAAGTGPCTWTNGDLNGSNSAYYEEDSTVQRLAIDGLANGTHTVTIEYQTTKGGKHAYDFLTNYNASESWVTQAALCASPVTSTFPSCASVAANTSPAIPHDPSNTLGTDDSNQHFTIMNGSISSVGTPGLVNGTYAGDSLTDTQLTFTVSTSSCADKTTDNKGVTTCPVLIAWGAHVSSQADWGPGSSAVNISGSPYHVKVVELDGKSVGSRDNQMAASAVVIPTTGTIIVDKVTNPSNDPQSFTFNTTGTGYTGFSLTDQATPNSQTLNAGTYGVSETIPAGWHQTSVVCTSDVNGTENPTAIQLTANETVTCVFTNTKDGSITIKKNVVGTNKSFTFTGDVSGSLSNTQTATANVVPGTYHATETTDPGYVLTNLSCDDNNSTGSTATGIATFNVEAGEHVTCTYTNSEIPTLKLNKTVVNDNGGTAVVNDFQAKIDGGNVTWGSVNNETVGAHTASEVSLPTYTASAWGGDCASNGSVTLAYGDHKVCSITNDDKAPTLKLVKTVTNDNGGTKQPSDWTLTATGAGGFSDAGNSTTFHPVTSGVSYVLSESAIAGYTAGSWSCDGGNQSGSNITLSLGQNVTCTINNNDVAPQLHLRKIVVNDNGGLAVASDWTLTADGTGSNDLSGATPVDSGATLKADTFALSESGPTGYAASSWACVGGSQTGSSITLGIGQSATCTITNDDIAPQLHLRKIVVNDNGGTSTVSNFTLTADGTGANDLSGTSPVDSGSGLKADTFALSETNMSGYTASSWVCVGGVQNGSNITLGLAQSATCTITNDDQPGHLIVHKATIPANDPTVFSVTLDSAPVTGSATQNLSTASDVNYTVNSGTYNVSEATTSLWAETGNTCNNVVVHVGQTKECTITNTELGTITIVKNAIPNDGQDFTFDDDFGNGNPSSFQLDDDNTVALPNSRDFVVFPGAYSVSEEATAGWKAAGAVCDDGSSVSAITVSSGEHVTCTFTNKKLATITLVKHTIGGNGTFDFTMTGDTLPSSDSLATLNGTATVDYQNIDPDNTYGITETAQSGWDLTNAQCVNENNVVDTTPESFSVNNGGHVTCTFTNTARGKIIVEKVAEGDQSASFGFTSDYGSGFSLKGGESNDSGFIVSGTYSVSETPTAGWDLTSATCDNNDDPSNITLKAGETVTCIFHNVQRGHLIVQKTTDPAADLTVFSITATGTGSITGGGAGTVTDVTDKDYEVTPGTYSVAETVPAGWQQTGNTCSNVAVGAGETKYCLINNQKLAKLTIVKDADPNDAQDFMFTGDLGSFTLDDDAGVQDGGDDTYSNTKSVDGLTPNQGYTVTEAPEPNAYWKFVGASCVLTGTATAYPATLTGQSLLVNLTPGTDVTCTFTNHKVSPTRTLGFWKTHTAYTSSIFSSLLGGNIQLGIAPSQDPINDSGKLFGAWYSNVANKSTGKGKTAQRTAVDQARIQLSWQWLAAKLNCAAFGCSTATQTLLNNASAAYAAGNQSAILNYAGQLDAFNNSGDTIIINGNPGKATPKDSSAIANLQFWDTP